MWWWWLGALVLWSACRSEGSPASDVPPDAAQRFAEGACDVARRCGCLPEFDLDLPHCEAERRAVFDEAAHDEASEFDPDCLEQMLDWWKWDACSSIHARAFPTCGIFVGTLPEGASCRPQTGGDVYYGPVGVQCELGLNCVDGTCRDLDVTDRVSPGESCDPVGGPWCDQGFCDDGRCVAFLTEGQTCSGASACGDLELYCAGTPDAPDSESTCKPKHAIGDACSPAEVESCEVAIGDGAHHYAYCGREGVCRPFWPVACNFFENRPDRRRVD